MSVDSHQCFSLLCHAVLSGTSKLSGINGARLRSYGYTLPYYARGPDVPDRKPVPLSPSVVRIQARMAPSQQTIKSPLEDVMNTAIVNPRCLIALLLFTLNLVASPWSAAATDDGAQKFAVELGDYRYHPDTIEVTTGGKVILELHNRDSITPHNFTLKDESVGLNIDTNVPAGKTVKVEFTAPAAGSYTFYCNKKLLFLESHRERGMKGTLMVHAAP